MLPSGHLTSNFNMALEGQSYLVLSVVSVITLVLLPDPFQPITDQYPGLGPNTARLLAYSSTLITSNINDFACYGVFFILIHGIMNYGVDIKTSILSNN